MIQRHQLLYQLYRSVRVCFPSAEVQLVPKSEPERFKLDTIDLQLFGLKMLGFQDVRARDVTVILRLMHGELVLFPGDKMNSITATGGYSEHVVDFVLLVQVRILRATEIAHRRSTTHSVTSATTLLPCLSRKKRTFRP